MRNNENEGTEMISISAPSPFFAFFFAALALFERKVGSISDLNLTGMKASLLVGNVSAPNLARASKGPGMWRDESLR